jgi:Holliday junction resolvasome RuvABC endonuclease subunit
MNINILAIDPSLNNTGIAVVGVDVATGLVSCVNYLKLAATEATDGKTVRKNSSDLQRARNIIAAINHAVTTYRPVVACAEVPTGTQSARGSISNGICIGVLASISVPLIEVSPMEVKMASCGKKTADKEDMVRWAVDLYPGAEWLFGKVKNDWDFRHEGKIISKHNEHLADAVAAAHAAVKTQQFQGMLAILKNANNNM